jgi:hypothetical protein
MPRYHPHAQVPHEHDAADHDEHEEQDNPIYTTRRTRSALELRARHAMAPSARFPAHLPRATGLSALIGEGFMWRKPKITQITTATGQLGAGETETEPDEPVSSRVTSCLWFHALSQAVLNALYPLFPSQIIFQPPV